MGETDGVFSICIQHLRRATCAQTPSSGYDLCSLFMSNPTGASTITFSYESTSGSITSVTSATPVTLGHPSLALSYGSSYQVSLTANYVLYNGVGQAENIVVQNPNTCSININNHQPVDLKASLRCINGAVLYRAGYLLALPAGGFGPCGVVGYQVEFTPVSNCFGDNPQSLETFVKGVNTSVARISLSYAFSHLPLNNNPNIGHWRVRWKPLFNGYEGTFGNSHIIAVNGTAPAGMTSSCRNDHRANE